MTFRILCGLLDGVIHEIVSGVAVVKVTPGAKKGIRPCCFGSDRQSLIRSLGSV
jgi:hypothetical protein